MEMGKAKLEECPECSELYCVHCETVEYCAECDIVMCLRCQRNFCPYCKAYLCMYCAFESKHAKYCGDEFRDRVSDRIPQEELDK